MNRYLPLLLLLACTQEKPKPVAGTPLTAKHVVPTLKVDTTHWADTTQHVDTTRSGDTTFFHASTTIAESTTVTRTTYRVTLPVVTSTIAYGPAQAPFTALCDTAQGYNATIYGVPRAKWVKVVEGTDTVLRQDTLANRLRNDAVTAALDSAAACKAKLALRIPRVELHDPVTGFLSVAEALREVRTWPKAWATHPGFLGFHLGDDPAAVGWGGTMAQRLAKWDSIACGTQQRFGAIPLYLRARPIQMEMLGRPWQCMTTSMPQWVHRLGEPTAYFQREIASAKRQKLGVVTALNLLAGGCGNLPATATRPACFAPGTSAPGAETGTYWMSPAEVTLAGNASLADPYVCGSLSWSYGANYPPRVGPHFHQVPANVAALRELGEKARLHPFTSCIQR